MKDKIKPGDLIILTIGALSLQRFVIFKVCEQISIPGGITTRVVTTSAHNLLLADNDFEFIQPSNSIPSVGDKILVINQGLLGVGRKYVVTKYQDELAWVSTNGLTGRLGRTNYEIIRQSKIESSGSCSDCGGTGTIVLFTSIAKCKCCNGDSA